jgi:hypothetical protein
VAFGLTVGSGSGEFTPQVRWDARAGRIHVVERVQGMAGWETQLNDVTASQPVFMIDFGTIQVGWLTFAPRPDFVTVPLGSPLPPRPSGDYKQGVVVQLFSPKNFGGKRELAVTSKAVLGPLDALHTAYLAAPESQRGMMPVVQLTGTLPVSTRGPQGNITNYSPQLVIVAWAPRPDDLGPVTVGAIQPPAAAKPMAAPPTPPPAPPQAAPQAAPGNGAAMPWDVAPAPVAASQPAVAQPLAPTPPALALEEALVTEPIRP